MMVLLCSASVQLFSYNTGLRQTDRRTDTLR